MWFSYDGYGGACACARLVPLRFWVFVRKPPLAHSSQRARDALLEPGLPLVSRTDSIAPLCARVCITQPGTTSSHDDFYLTNHRLAISETTNSQFNKTWVKENTRPQSLVVWQRCVSVWTRECRVFACISSIDYSL